MLVASTCSRQPGGWAWHRAFWIATRSGAGAAPGATVIVVDFVTLNHFAVIVTVVLAVTTVVETLNVPLDALALTTVSAGTLATAGLLLDSCTLAASGIGPVNVTVPVAELPPVIVEGVTDTDESELPPGVAGLTERLA